MNQKQAVATLYLVAIVLGLCAVMIVSTGYMKVVLSIAALAGTAYTVTRIARYPHYEQPRHRHRSQDEAQEGGAGVPHEDLGGVAVVGDESDAPAHQGRADHRHLHVAHRPP